MFDPTKGFMPVQMPEILEFNRQRKLADLLTSTGMQTPQGQIVGGVYVPTSPFEYIGNIAKIYAGSKLGEDIEKKQIDLAEQLRKGKEQETRAIIERLSPRDVQTEMAGPYTGNVPMPVVTQTMPPDIQGAMNLALQSQYGAGKELLPTLIQRSLPEPIKPTTDMQNYEYAKSTGFKGSFNDFRNQMTPYQQAQLSIERERLDLEKIKNLAKPLPEGLNKQVTGAVNLTDAITDYQSKIANFGIKEFANPNKRAEMGNAYNNMMLQAKEAYNLGVLNGPDYAILQKVVRDPTNVSSLAFANDSLSRQADSLRDTAKSIVRNAYMSQGREVPADIAVKFTKTELPKTEKQTVKEQLGLPSQSAIDAELRRRGLK